VEKREHKLYRPSLLLFREFIRHEQKEQHFPAKHHAEIRSNIDFPSRAALLLQGFPCKWLTARPSLLVAAARNHWGKTAPCTSQFHS
jgi:hypothetical protein